MKQDYKVDELEEKLFMCTDWSVKIAFHDVFKAEKPKLCVKGCETCVRCELSAIS